LNNLILKKTLLPLITIALIIIWWGNHLTGGANDLAVHYVLLKKIIIDGSVNVGYYLNLDEMVNYPPGAHYFAAIVNKLSNNLIVSMNIINIISMVTIYTCIANIIYKYNNYTILFILVFIIAIFRININIPIIGLEITKGNFLFGQLLGSAIFIYYYFCCLTPHKNQINYVYLYLIFFIILFIHATPALMLAATFFINKLINEVLMKEKNINIILKLLFISIIFMAIFVFHPYTQFASGEMRLHNGYIFFDYITTGPENINKIGILYILISAILSLVFLIKILTKKIKTQIYDIKVYSVFIGISFLTFIYYFLYLSGNISLYVVKKNLFIQSTFFIIVIGSLLFEKKLNNSIFYIKKRIGYSEILIILYLAIMLPVFGQTQESPSFVNQEINRVIEISKVVKENSNYSNKTIFRNEKLSVEYNWLISLAELEIPKKSIYTKALLDDNIELLPNNSFIIDSTRIEDEQELKFTNGLSLYTKDQYIKPPILFSGQTVDLNSNNKYLNRYLKAGFTKSETWGTWTNSSKSTIQFRVSKGKQNLLLTINHKTWLYNNHKNINLKIYFNNKNIHNVNINKSEVSNIKLILDRKFIDTKDDTIKLEFYIEKLSSPFDQNESKDKRNLGIGFISMNLE